MASRDLQIRTALPPQWVWTVLTDVANLERWSAFERCHDGDERRLHQGSSWDCRTSLGGRAVAATVTVIELTRTSLTIRSETAIHMTIETFTVTPAPPGADINYELRAHSRLAPPALNRWVDEHSQRVHHGLQQLLHVPTPT